MKPSLRKEFFTVKREWMPADSCNNPFDEYFKCKLNNKEWKPSKCCQDYNKHEKRTLALFKQEYQGQNPVSLAPKSYFCSGEDGNKSGSKGVQMKQKTSPSNIISKFWKLEFPKLFKMSVSGVTSIICILISKTNLV